MFVYIYGCEQCIFDAYVRANIPIYTHTYTHTRTELEAGPNADKSVETMNWQNTLNGLVPDQGPEELPHYTTHINALNNVKTGFKVFFGVCAAAVIGGVTYALMR